MSRAFQEGTHAKVEATLVWKPTQLGLRLKKLLAQRKDSEWDSRRILKDNSFVIMPVDSTEYRNYETFAFDKYDDGWRLK